MIFHFFAPYRGTDANFDLTTHEYHKACMKSQKKKRKQERKSSGGLVIEELVKGKSNGKIATRGKEVDCP